MMKFVALALLLSAANAACPNKCSGHGDCTVNDLCVCYQDWQSGDEAGGDCSDRTCAFDIAWADTPTGEDVAHGYAECSGRGTCNRKSGLCECFDGFTGKACRRTTCPNDCSGHGTCEYLADVQSSGFDGTLSSSDYNFGHASEGRSNNDFEHDLLGDLWDAKKTRMCVCDPKWTDVDCSRRMCPIGNDPLSRANEGNSGCDGEIQSDPDEIQHVCFGSKTGYTQDLTGTVALVYSDLFGNKYTTQAFPAGATAAEVQILLRSLPDHALESVVVTETDQSGVDLTRPACVIGSPYDGGTASGYAVTFTGAQVSGEQPLLDVLIDECLDGCQPQRTGLDYDITVVGQDDSVYTGLNDPVDHIDYNTGYEVIRYTEADGNAYECGRRGKCNYDSGICECFTGFTDEDCSTQSALA